MTEISKGPRRWRRRLLGAAIGVLIGLLLAEGLLRVMGYSPTHVNPLHAFHCADPVLVYRGKPNVEGRFRRPQFDVTVHHDARGFRMPEFSREANEVQGTVHVFGDSFTWGWGVETGEVFTDRLRRTLPDRAVRNYGINGSGTAMQARLLETEVAGDVRPGDRVVLMFFYNDFFDNVNESRLHGRIEGDDVVEVVPESNFEPTIGKAIGAWIKESSYLVNFVLHVWDLRKASRIAEAQRESTDPRGDGPPADDRRVTRHFLARFRDVCGRLKAELTVVWVPDSRDVAARVAGRPSSCRDVFFEVARSVGIEPVDPTDAFVAAGKDGTQLYFENDDHWTPRGHAVMAEVLAEELRR